jgi:mRNA interferase HigB
LKRALGAWMHIIAKPIFAEAAKEYPEHATAIMDTYKAFKSGKFENPHELRKTFPKADNFKHVKKWWVIDIAGNNIRLIACIVFGINTQTMFVKHIVNHTEYDKLNSRYEKGELP